MPGELFGGNESFKNSLANEMAAAVSQLGGMSDAGVPSKKQPSFVLTADVWPPLFKKGCSVEFHVCSPDGVVPGDFVVVRRRARLTVCRMINWKFNGSLIEISVIEDPYKRELVKLAPGTFLGAVETVGRVGDKERFKPNDRSWYANLKGALTKFGTCNPLVGFFDLMREGMFVISNQQEEERPKEASFLESLRNVNQWHRETLKEEEEQARIKALQEEAAKEELERTKAEIGDSQPNQWWTK